MAADVQAELNIDLVKTRTVERLIEPLIHQVTSLTDANSMRRSGGGGKSGAVLVAAVDRTVRNFVHTARAAIAHCSITAAAAADAVQQLAQAVELVEQFGMSQN
ncbi:unnamed protein product [Gongylonema pulchrum]|uniref:Conserved oligomeric Golgi complex subunit 7 n=1 Tax=Gongylonema pulchrum TaxID=637853 RepID=A0A183EII7_9BILA|nr:unnamed protein product [Gongylonema pulchrum]